MLAEAFSPPAASQATQEEGEEGHEVPQIFQIHSHFKGVESIIAVQGNLHGTNVLSKGSPNAERDLFCHSSLSSSPLVVS